MRLGEWYQRAEAATSVGIGPSGLPVTEDSGNGIPTQPPAGGSCRADSFVAAGDNMLLRPSRLPMTEGSGSGSGLSPNGGLPLLLDGLQWRHAAAGACVICWCQRTAQQLGDLALPNAARPLRGEWRPL